MAGPLDDKFDLIAGASDEFIDALKGIDQQLALNIIKIYSRFVVGNELVLDATELAKLDDSIVAAIKTTDYKELVDKYLPNFDLLGDLNKELHLQENQINIEDLLRENDKINNHLSAVEAQLRGTNAMKIQVTTDGVRRVTNIPNDSLDKLVKPISEMIRQDVLLGVSFESATEQMLEAISAGNLGLEQWASQIARDALSQHDGIQQQQIKEDFDLQYHRYIGTIKNTTRPICYHLLVKKDEPVYTDDELQAVLNEYVPGGVPSISTTTSTADGTRQKKGNGIIPGTDLGNFTIRRGGYNCRHQLIPTVLGPDEQETVEEPTTETPQEFVPAKNKREAGKQMRSLYNDQYGHTVKNITYDKSMSIDDINQRNKQIHKLVNEYNTAYSPSEFNLRYKSGSEYLGVVYYRHTGTWREGTRKMGNKIQSINYGHKNGRSRILRTQNFLKPGGKLPYNSLVDGGNVKLATTTHEFAHTITNSDQGRKFTGGKLIDKFGNKVDPKLADFWDEMKVIRKEYADEIRPLIGDFTNPQNLDNLNGLYLGDYASTDIDEFFAEGFTEYKLSSNPSKYALKIGKLVDKTFKK